MVAHNVYAYCANNPVNYKDETGEFIISALITAVVVGAVAGLAGKYVEDVTYNVASGAQGWDILKPTSSWQDYASSGISGGVMGGLTYVAPGSSLLAKNAVDALLKPTVKQTLEIVSGERKSVDFAELGRDATIRFGTSWLKVPGKYTPYDGINKMIGNLSSNVARGGIKYVRKDVIPSFQARRTCFCPYITCPH